MRIHEVLQNQSLLDCCIQLYGTLERLPELAALNGLGFTSPLQPGQALIHNAGANASAKALQKAGRIVATGDRGGIGALIISTTFIIY